MVRTELFENVSLMCHLDKAEARSLLHVEVVACWPSRKHFDDVLNVISLVSNCCAWKNTNTCNTVTHSLVWPVSLGCLFRGEYCCDVLVTRLHPTNLKLRTHTSTDMSMSPPTKWLCVDIHIPGTHAPLISNTWGTREWVEGQRQWGHSMLTPLIFPWQYVSTVRLCHKYTTI